MAPVTEIVIAPLKPEADLSVLAAPNAMLRRQPGCTAVRHARQREDPAKLVLFVDWDDVSSHRAFQQKTVEYQAYLAAMATATRADDADPDPALFVCHVALDPPPTLLSSASSTGTGGPAETTIIHTQSVLDVAPVTEVVHMYFAADLSDEAQRQILEHTRQGKETLLGMAKGLVGEVTAGFALETVGYQGAQARVLVALAGWESVEARTAFTESEAAAPAIAMMEAIPGALGKEIYLVQCKLG